MTEKFTNHEENLTQEATDVDLELNGTNGKSSEKDLFTEKMKEAQEKYKQRYDVLHRYPQLNEQVSGLDEIERNFKSIIKLKESGEAAQEKLSRNMQEIIKDKDALSEHFSKIMSYYGKDLRRLYDEHDMRVSMAERGDIEELKYSKDEIYLLFDKYLNLHGEILSKSFDYSFNYDFNEELIGKMWERYHEMIDSPEVKTKHENKDSHRIESDDEEE